MNVKLQNSLEVYAWKAEPAFPWRSLVWFALAIVELLLVTPLLLKLFGLYATSDLTSILGSISEYLLLPLFVVFRISPTAEPVFEWVTLVAIILYWLLVMGIVSFFSAGKKVSRIESARAYSKRKYGH